MKNVKRIVTVLLSILAVLGLLAGCTSPASSAAASSAAPASGSASAMPSGEMQTIGIIQIIEHPALDAAYEGFVAALADNGFVDGENIELDFQNAQGDTNNLSTISDRFVSQEKDLVLAIATDSAQAIAAKTTEIPILATAVTSYTTAGLIDSDDAPGGNISGTSDMNPVAAQIDLLVELVPEVQTVGLLYNSSEDNSVLQINIAKEHIESLGLAWEEITVTNVNDVQQATQSLVTRCDAIYIPTDNTIAAAMATVSGVAVEAGIPTICGESNMVLGGGLATMGINYFDLGYKTGLMAIEVLNGADISTMPIQFADSSDEVTINGLTAADMGFTIPEQYTDAVVEPEDAA